jgi:hypothetical protein
MGEDSTEYDIPQGRKVDRIWGLLCRTDDNSAMQHAYGDAETKNVKRLRDLNKEMWREFTLFKYAEESNIVDWDQWEIMQRYVAKEARGEQGKRGEPKVNRWIREMMYDYENSRWYWALQVYALHGVLADMSEHMPQNVAWKAYVDSCIYDGCYKVMNTVRILGIQYEQ